MGWISYPGSCQGKFPYLRTAGDKSELQKNELTLAYVSPEGKCVLMPSGKAAEIQSDAIKGLLCSKADDYRDNGKFDIMIHNGIDTGNQCFSGMPGEQHLIIRLGKHSEQVVERYPGYFEFIPTVNVSLEVSVSQAPAALKLLNNIADPLANGA